MGASSDSDEEFGDKKIEDLCIALFQLKGAEEFRQFLFDLLTPQELIELSRRWAVAQALHVGRTQREISTELRCGTATVTRVNNALRRGKGGYRLVLDRLMPPSHRLDRQ